MTEQGRRGTERLAAHIARANEDNNNGYIDTITYWAKKLVEASSTSEHNGTLHSTPPDKEDMQLVLNKLTEVVNKHSRWEAANRA